jgi:4-diphosphocytidyl-2-C-methyl-D-erythritol kinase
MLFQKTSLTVKSFAKINVSLKVLSKREDGYHELEMVNLPLEMHDIIEVEKMPSGSDTFITCDDIGLSHTRHNLCAKAVEAMRDEFKFKESFNISIHKEIPFAAGLGGGSSNAAAVMMALVTLLHIKTTPEVLSRIALSIGADVPFFLLNKPAYVTGIGEKLQLIPAKKQYNCLIVKPQDGLSTTDVFAIADKFDKCAIDTPNVIKAISTGDDALLVKSVGNDLFAPANSLLPEVGKVVASLKADGLPLVSMSGSGSSVFALSNDPKLLAKSARKYMAQGYIVRLTKTMM